MAHQSSAPAKWLKWLTPGIGIKRWFGLLLFGAALMGLSFAALLVEVYHLQPELLQPVLFPSSGAVLWPWALLGGIAGLALVLMAAVRISRSLLAPLAMDGGALVDAMVEHRQRQRGPRIVAIGGGTGLPTLLRGLKGYTANLTAIVTVADDGGSSGKLRREMDILPPGDLRNNIAALARDEDLMTQLFHYRFGEGLEHHSFGNLFITAMQGITGSFESAIMESSRVLAIRGQVMPSTLENVTLMADVRMPDGNGLRRVSGESAIPKQSGVIDRVFLVPEDVPAYPEARRAILNADLIVIGPGSLFTSILPNLLIHDIAQAVRASKAMKVYVCNVATQQGETDGFSVVDHVAAIERHVGKGLIEHVIANDEFPSLKDDSRTIYVQTGTPGSEYDHISFHTAPLVDGQRPWRHDSVKLARAIVRLFEQSRQAAP
ncbi:MAG: YvcK family protein [Anaerolineae bacterium]